MKNQLSIVIPAYNADKHLNACVESIGHISDELLELLMVDDGSCDNTPLYCDDLVVKNNSIICIHKTNGGLSSARNAGLDLAQGEYVTFVDSDDFVSVGYIESITGLINRQKDLAVFSYSIDHTENRNSTQISLKDEMMYTDEAVKEMDALGAFNVVWNKVYKRELIQASPKVRFAINSEPGEDLLFNCEYFKRAKTVATASDVLYHWVRRGEDTLANKFYPDLFEKNKVFIEQRNELYKHLNLNSDSDKKQLYKGNAEYIFVCIPNMYRGKGKTFTRKKRLAFYKEIINDDQVATWINGADLTGFLIKSFKSVYNTHSPFIMDAYYSALMFGRSHFQKAWIYIRSKINH